jgi:intein-encoded DNA endonuclease-like protein
MGRHYVYKITNLLNNKVYIGVRTHPDPDNDNYMGSSKIISNLINIEGINNFKKEILHYFDTRQEAENKEKEYLTEEFCNDPNTYNIHSNSGLNGDAHGFRKDLWYDYYNDIRKQYKQEVSTITLAKKYKCDKGTIKMICNDILRTASESQQIRFKITTSGARDLEFDKTHLNELIKLYNEDKWSVNRIASYFNKSTSFITKRLIENDIQIRGRKDNFEKPMKKDRPEVWESKNKIVSLYENGYTLRDLGKKYKCNDSLIKQILIQNNIKIRNKSENTRMKSNDIINLYQQGHTITKIQKMTHTNFNIIKEIINQYICQQ